MSTRSIAVFLLLSVSACASPPRKSLADAQAALSGLGDKRDCVPEQYAAAEAMLDRARKASEAGDYEEAKTLAESARDLARRAGREADRRWSTCRARPEPPAKPTPPPVVAPAPVEEESWTLQTVHFDLNSVTLNEAARSLLKKNAEWLLRHPDVSIIVSGHCDERGSTEYNLALGQQRAAAVQKYLASLGVPTPRLRVVSYGEEVPVGGANDEAGWAKNRRAEFRIR